jgi:NAD(P)-dependent dehydrogenase (short-subunit alcohol dehydrogenase family)
MPVYCITGANRGLGLEFVRQLAQDTSNTIIACIRSNATDTSDLQFVASKTTHILVCDTGSSASISSFTKALASTLSNKKIDFLLNNAGVNSVSHQTALTIGEEDLHREIQINVLGPATIVSKLVDAGLLAESARIMNMTSGLGSMERSLGISPRKCATYSISKGALNMLTVHQSGDLREKLKEVVVVCMDPGWVKTRMGGEAAVLEKEVSIKGMLETVHGLKGEDNGKFLTYDGSVVPW